MNICISHLENYYYKSQQYGNIAHKFISVVVPCLQMTLTLKLSFIVTFKANT